jgi:hypothetical protein
MDINSTQASTGMLTDAGYTTASESDAASDAVSEAGTERDMSDFDIDSSSEFDSFSEVSAPSNSYAFGTPRSESPGPPSTPGGMASGDDWSDVGGDTDMEVMSSPSSGAATPARAESPPPVDSHVSLAQHVEVPATASPRDSTWSTMSTSRLQRYSVLAKKTQAMDSADAQILEPTRSTRNIENDPVFTDDNLDISFILHGDAIAERNKSLLDDEAFLSANETNVTSRSSKDVATEPDLVPMPESASLDTIINSYFDAESSVLTGTYEAARVGQDSIEGQ